MKAFASSRASACEAMLLWSTVQLSVYLSGGCNHLDNKGLPHKTVSSLHIAGICRLLYTMGTRLMRQPFCAKIEQEVFQPDRFQSSVQSPVGNSGSQRMTALRGEFAHRDQTVAPLKQSRNQHLGSYIGLLIDFMH